MKNLIHTQTIMIELLNAKEALWNGCTNHNILLVVPHIFIIESDHGLSKANYDRIVEWERSIFFLKGTR